MLRNERGVALGAARVVMVAVGVGSFYMIKSSQQSSDISAKEIKDIRARAEAKKIFSMAGFLISNNLILCKSKPWGAGNTPMQCQWSGTKAEKTYKPEDFGFTNLRFDGNHLTFDILNHQMHGKLKSNKVLSLFPGTVSLKLVDTNKDKALEKVVGVKSEEVKAIDDDHYVVKVDLNLMLSKNEENQKISAGAVFKRPIAIPKLTVLDSTCISLCNASKGEHPFPACRGPFTIDVNTKTDVVALTENLGPGVLYDIDYERNVVFRREVEGVRAPAASTVDVPLNDFLEAGNKVEWVDQVECGTFVQNITRTVRGSGPTTTEQNISQHSEPAGSLNYNIKVNSKLSRIEPFRLNNEVIKEEGSFKGKLEQNITTIYVEPPH